MAKEFPLFDAKAAENLQKSSRDCYNNGVELLEEANMLYDHECYARAVSLAILSEEEFAKGIILLICATHNRWDKEIHNSLRNHGGKQAISELSKEIINLIINRHNFLKNSFVPRQIKFKDVESKLDSISKKIKTKYIKNIKRDKRKQDAQFVDISEHGLASKLPKIFTQKDAQIDIDTAARTKASLELLYGERTYDDPIFRPDHCFYIGMANELTLGHKSGITVAMKYSFLREKEFALDVATVEMYTSYDNQINIFELNTLSNEQKKKLASLYKAYDALNQIRQEMQELGLRDTTYLEEVENLIADYAHEQ